ncbi:unnamed protein product [Euphydryas editha]|uniref:C2H2-type domain-containing protein n=1 Tax=Euphydryas editha TaxID=104508 RepID=A0AAU9TD19_EUPED|nr:unnamed protein product [Euphydryas editha]
MYDVYFIIYSVKTKQVPSNTCEGCGKSFGNGGLRYHIRRSHYNLVAKITSHDEKQMNEVWYESVLNTDSVVEIKKAGHNLLFIRKLESNKEVRLSDDNVLIDFTSLYPTGNKVTTTTCDICNIEMLKRDFKKHYDEKHGKLRKHHCNNCNVTFKRSYLFLRHTCNKTKTRRTRKLPCQISKVESFTPIPV